MFRAISEIVLNSVSISSHKSLNGFLLMKLKSAAQTGIFKIRYSYTIRPRNVFLWHMLRNDSGKILKAFVFIIKPQCFRKNRKLCKYSRNTAASSVAQFQSWAEGLQAACIAVWHQSRHSARTVHSAHVRTKAAGKSHSATRVKTSRNAGVITPLLLN